MSEIDITPITHNLFVASRMTDIHAEDLEALDVDLIISMIAGLEPPEIFGKAPFQMLWLETHDSFLHPIPLEKLERGVTIALPYIKGNKKVLVFCREGKRRSVTMAAAILIATGMSSDEAMSLIKDKRAIADPYRFYIKQRIRAFEKYWRKNEKAV